MHLELGCAALIFLFLSQFSPVHEVILTSGDVSSSSPSQKNPPSLVSATFVNNVFRLIVCIAIGFVFEEVPASNISYSTFEYNVEKTLV